MFLKVEMWPSMSGIWNSGCGEERDSSSSGPVEYMLLYVGFVHSERPLHEETMVLVISFVFCGYIVNQDLELFPSQPRHRKEADRQDVA